MKVNGAWNIESFPMHYVAELGNGELKMFAVNPMKELKEEDLMTYKGYHPRKLKGQPMPEYMFKFYGLEKNDEKASEVVRTRLTPTEKKQIENFAKSEGKTVSEVIREFVRGVEIKKEEKKMKTMYELKSNHIEVKSLKALSEGCTLEQDSTYPELIKSFEDKQEALDELKKYKTETRDMSNYYLVTEFYVEIAKYDDGEWVDGGDIVEFTKFKI
jgi:hypothetical protein